MQYTIGITVNIEETADPAGISSELTTRVVAATEGIDGVTSVVVTEVVTEG